MNTGKAFKFLREDQRMTQRQAAKRSGLSAAYIGRIENNKNEPSKKAREKLMRALGVHPIQVWLRSIEPEDIPEDKRHLYFKLFPAIEGLVSLLVDDFRQDGLKIERHIITPETEVKVETNSRSDDAGMTMNEDKFELKTRDGHLLADWESVFWIKPGHELHGRQSFVMCRFDPSIMQASDCFHSAVAAQNYIDIIYPEK
jgi:transcriptional regulator with XRE-family HTH domain